jgi:hypothetical protein
MQMVLRSPLAVLLFAQVDPAWWAYDWQNLYGKPAELTRSPLYSTLRMVLLLDSPRYSILHITYHTPCQSLLKGKEGTPGLPFDLDLMML